jgi:hypothetical protein
MSHHEQRQRALYPFISSEISPIGAPAPVCCQSFSPSGKQRLCVARTSQIGRPAQFLRPQRQRHQVSFPVCQVPQARVRPMRRISAIHS